MAQQEVNYLSKLKKTAKKSSHKQFKHATLILKGGKVLTAKSNTTHLHSEARAIKSLWPGEAMRSVAINIRIRNDGSFGNSAPCNDCMKLLKKERISKVIYTNEAGWFVTRRI